MAAKRSTKKTSTPNQARGKPAAKKSPQPRLQPRRAQPRRAQRRAPPRRPEGPPPEEGRRQQEDLAQEAASKKAGGSAAADRVLLVQEIIDVMEARGAVEVEFKDGDFKLRVRRREEHPPTAWPIRCRCRRLPCLPLRAAAPATGAGEAAPADDPDALPPGTEVFPSPMVGTFYSRAARSRALRQGGRADRVRDHVVCIIEAMKVMNEIKAERSFEVVRVLAENGEPVEFGQPLFVIKA